MNTDKKSVLNKFWRTSFQMFYTMLQHQTQNMDIECDV